MSKDMHTRIDTHIQACTHAKCTHTYLLAYLHTYIHTYMTYIRTYVPTNLRTYIRTYMHTYVHACMHACMHANIHIHTYLPTYVPMLKYVCMQICLLALEQEISMYMCISMKMHHIHDNSISPLSYTGNTLAACQGTRSWEGCSRRATNLGVAAASARLTGLSNKAYLGV